VIPDEILGRPKEGFSEPVAPWISGGLEHRVRDSLLDPSAVIHGVVKPRYIQSMVDDQFNRRANHAIRNWNLLCLETWVHSFKVRLF
jgi:asparagine synthetase B (glutamine-hydrolysing)